MDRKAMRCRQGCTFRTSKGVIKGFEKDQVVKSEADLNLIEGSQYFVEDKPKKSKK